MEELTRIPEAAEKQMFLNRLPATPTILLSITATAVILSVTVAAGLTGWPGLHVDAAYFATPLVLPESDGTWQFGNYTDNLARSANHEYRGHGFLSMLLFRPFLSPQDYSRLHVVFAVWNVVCIAVSMVAGYVWPKHLSKHARLLVSVAVGISTCLVSLTIQGRPEHSAMFLVPLFVIVHRVTSSPFRRLLVTSLLLSLLLISSPLTAAIATLPAIWYQSEQNQDKSTFQLIYSNTLLGSCALLFSFILLTLCSPWSFMEWFRDSFGTRLTLPQDPLGLIRPKYWKGRTIDAPLWQLQITMVTLLMLCRLVRLRHFVQLIATAIILWPIIKSAKDYSFSPFIPAFLLLQFSDSESCKFRLPAIFTKLVCIGQTAICSVLLIRHAWSIGFIAFAGGVSVHEASNRIHQLVQVAAADSGCVGFEWSRPSFICCGPAGDQYLTVNTSPIQGVPGNLAKLLSQSGRRLKYVVLPQYRKGLPPEHLFVEDKRFLLVEDAWRPSGLEYFGVPIAARVPGYQYAVYQLEK